MSSAYPADAAEDAWRWLITTVESVRRDLDHELADRRVLREVDFIVLDALMPYGQRGCQPSVFAAAIEWEPSRLSHQLTRMERRGLIERQRAVDVSDRRKTRVRATRLGKRLHAATREQRAALIESRFQAALSGAQAGQLVRLLKLLNAPGGSTHSANAPIHRA